MLLDKLAADIVAKTGCPIEVARTYLKAFLRVPAAQAAVIAAARQMSDES
jgi:fructose-specific phosphotransferase system component IIB